MGIRTFPTIEAQAAAARVVWENTFPGDPTGAGSLFVPYRICPLGAHIDHQGGPVLGRTISAGTLLLYLPTDGPEVQLASSQFPGLARFRIGQPIEGGHWARYAQAAALALGQVHTLHRGIRGVVTGSLVGAGLASSASVGLAYLQALAEVNGFDLDRTQLIDLDQALENTFLGLDNGIQDQSAILHGTEGSLVLTDTRQRQAARIPDPPEAAFAAWLVVFSGVSRELTVGGDFNRRVEECRQAARWLQPGGLILSDISQETFDRRAGEMPEALRLRAAHFYSEVWRVKAGAQAWRSGDLAQFGALMNLSGESSIHQYQSANEPIIRLQRIVQETPGVYGGRFSGGGGGGCVVALVEREQGQAVAEGILASYKRHFPQHADRAAVYLAGGSRES